MSEGPIRKVLVLKQVEVPWTSIKEGDIFRTLEASTRDVHARPNKWELATCDGYAMEENPHFGIEIKKDFSVEEEISSLLLKSEVVGDIRKDTDKPS